jgi:hypothetical protein
MYAHLILTVLHQFTSGNCAYCRYCVSFSTDDPLFSGFDIDRWLEPGMRKILMRSLCEDWAESAIDIVGCQEIAGAVQWGRLGLQ